MVNMGEMGYSRSGEPPLPYHRAQKLMPDKSYSSSQGDWYGQPPVCEEHLLHLPLQ